MIILNLTEALVLGIIIGYIKTKNGNVTYFAAALSSITFLFFPFPSSNIVLFPTVKVPFLVEKSGKHLWRTVKKN